MLVIFRRFLQMLVIIAALSVALFGLMSAMPGNPVDLLITSNPRIKPEDVIRLKKLRGLDKPWYVQYVRWMWGYYEPLRPIRLGDIETQTLHLDAQGRALLRIDLAGYVEGASERLSFAGLKTIANELNADRAKEMLHSEEVQNASGNEVVDVAMEYFAVHDPAMHAAIQKRAHDDAMKRLELKGLFGASATGFVLEKEFRSKGESRVYFALKDANGLEIVGIVPVSVVDAGQGTAENAIFIDSIPTQLIDDPSLFRVDLPGYVHTTSKVRYELLPGSPGQIDANGIYRHRFNHPGQSVIQFAIRDESGKVGNAAFAVDHGPIPDKGRFNNGFLFFFLGDKNALGFSNTYKRPVWELLWGNEAGCNLQGDGDSCADSDSVQIAGFLSNMGRIGNTLALMLPALLLSLLIALPLGVLSAYRRYSWLDYCMNFFAFVGISLPVFWFGIMMLFVFAEYLQWFPAGGISTPGVEQSGLGAFLNDRLEHAILPTLVLSIAYVGQWLRYMRSSMLEVLPADYIRTARAKGLGERAVVLKHALRNALIPVVTVLALSIPVLFSGAVLTETVFSWPGIGRLQYDAVMNSDYYVAIVVFLISAVFVMFGNLLADILYVLVDPRIRKG